MANDKTTVLVTGANKGIGYEVARRLGRDHGMAVLVGSRDAGRGNEAVDKLRADGIDARLVRLDVGDPATVAAAAATLDRLDVLVNNAGIAQYAKPSEETLATLRRTFETNTFGPITVMQAMLPLLRQSKAARVVNVSSGLGSMSMAASPPPGKPWADVLAYNASKAALNMATILLARELAPAGIKVNLADPGYTATDLNQHAGYRTVEQAATVIVRLATLADDGPTGGFFDEDGPVPW